MRSKHPTPPPPAYFQQESLGEKITEFLNENQSLRPQMKLMFEYESLVLMDKMNAFVNAGFNREEAFALVLAEI